MLTVTYTSLASRPIFRTRMGYIYGQAEILFEPIRLQDSSDVGHVR